MEEINYAYQKSVSYSQYSIYKTCPFQWYLSYPKKKLIFRPSIHLVFGTSIHETLQYYFKEMYDKSAAAADRLDILEYFKNNFIENYKKALIDNKNQHFSSPQEMQEFYDDGVSIIDWFKKKRNKYFSKRNTELIGIEIPILSQANRGIDNVFMRGAIDIILYNTLTQTYTIYDIKTSTRGWSAQDKKDNVKYNQILLYKKFFSKIRLIPEEKIDVCFFIVKRKIPQSTEYPVSRIQEFRPKSGKIKVKKAYEDFMEFINECFEKNGEYREREYPKNIGKSCNFCPYNQRPDLCNKDENFSNKFFVD